jgi:hypothetical protein
VHAPSKRQTPGYWRECLTKKPLSCRSPFVLVDISLNILHGDFDFC